MKKAFVISGVFISSLIGAGFASGGEILYYFSRYGIKGLFALIGSIILFGVLQYLVVAQSASSQTFSFDEYLALIMNKKAAMVIGVIAYIFMAIIFSAMLSGFGQMCNQMFGIKKLYGVIIMLICCYLVLNKGYEGFVKTESVLSVIIIASIFLAVLYILMFRENSTAVFSLSDSAAVSGLSYVSYNILTLSSVLCVVGREADVKTAKVAAIITGLVLSVLMTGMWYILCIYLGMISLGEIPFLTICMRQSQILGLFYGAVIFISMLTTAVSNSYVLGIKLCKFTGEKTANTIVMMTGLLLSAFDFSFVVDKMYRFVGIISIVLVFFIIKYNLKKSELLRK